MSKVDNKEATRMFQTAQVGDSVYSLKYGEGVIAQVNPKAYKHNLIVEFTRNLVHLTFAYNFDGKRNKADRAPELYWGVPTIEAPAAPTRFVKRQGFINLYKVSGNRNVSSSIVVHATEDSAKAAAATAIGATHIATVGVEWEEEVHG